MPRRGGHDSACPDGQHRWPLVIVGTTACDTQSPRRFAVPETTCHMSISLDGFVAGPDQSRQDPLGKRGRELHGWHIGDPRANRARM